MDINNSNQSSILTNWLAGLFTDQHKKPGYIICEIERRLPASGCSLGVTPITEEATISVLNRSALSIDELANLFKTAGEGTALHGADMAVCRLEVPSVQGEGCYIYLFGQKEAVAANVQFLKPILALAEQKSLEPGGEEQEDQPNIEQEGEVAETETHPLASD